MDRKTQEKRPHRTPRRVLIFLLVAVFLLAGCGVGAAEAKDKLAIGFVILRPFPNIQSIPRQLFGHQIPREALTDLSTARVSIAQSNEPPLKLFKEISGVPDEATVTRPYQRFKEMDKEEAIKDTLEQLKDLEDLVPDPDVVPDPDQNEAKDAIAEAIAEAVKQNQASDKLEREGSCALAKQRFIQEAWAYHYASEYVRRGEQYLGLFPLVAPSDRTIDQWVEDKGRTLQAAPNVKNAAKDHMKSFRNRLWYPPGSPPRAQPPLNRAGYAQVAYAYCPSAPLIRY